MLLNGLSQRFQARVWEPSLRAIQCVIARLRSSRSNPKNRSPRRFLARDDISVKVRCVAMRAHRGYILHLLPRCAACTIFNDDLQI